MKKKVCPFCIKKKLIVLKNEQFLHGYLHCSNLNNYLAQIKLF